MLTLEKLQAALKTLTLERSQVTDAGWVLQNCWLVQVKPGGTARTDTKYWQVRSRQPILDGKKLKHLKPEEVDDYRAAIARGRQLKAIDRQIEKVQRQLQQLTTAGTLIRSQEPAPLNAPLNDSHSMSERTNRLQRSLEEQSVNFVTVTDMSEQDRLVKAVLADSQALRTSLRQSMARCKQSGAKNLDLRQDISA